MLQRGAQFVFSLPEQVEACLLDLRYRKPHGVFGELLAVLANHFCRRAGPQGRADLKKLLGILLQIDFAQCF